MTRGMEQLDCNDAMIRSGVTTTADNFKMPGSPNEKRYTQALFANEDITVKVKDCYGNITTMNLVAGVQVVGSYGAVWSTDSNGAITQIAAGKVILTF